MGENMEEGEDNLDTGCKSIFEHGETSKDLFRKLCTSVRKTYALLQPWMPLHR